MQRAYEEFQARSTNYCTYKMNFVNLIRKVIVGECGQIASVVASVGIITRIGGTVIEIFLLGLAAKDYPSFVKHNKLGLFKRGVAPSESHHSVVTLMSSY